MSSLSIRESVDRDVSDFFSAELIAWCGDDRLANLANLPTGVARGASVDVVANDVVASSSSHRPLADCVYKHRRI